MLRADTGFFLEMAMEFEEGVKDFFISRVI